MELEMIIEALEGSVKKNGEKPLTNKWLLNLLKQVQAKKEKIEEYYENDHTGDGYDEFKD